MSTSLLAKLMAQLTPKLSLTLHFTFWERCSLLVIYNFIQMVL